MSCQILFSRKNKKNMISLSSAEFAHSMVSDKMNIHMNILPISGGFLTADLFT